MKRIFTFSVLITLIGMACYAQDATFSTINVQNIIKGGGYNDIFGWGRSINNSVDPRPYSPEGGAFYINNHQGLTFSAHSFYGGIRFYNQSYPGSPFDPSNGAKMVMSINNNSVGIGTTDPMNILHVSRNNQQGEIRIGGSNDLNNGRIFIQADFVTDNSYIDAYGDNVYKRLSIEASHLILNDLSAGNVGIGTNSPTEKLSVNGKIRSREIKVENDHWPDYVFAKSYQLPTLSETEKYIKENGHLPGIPSAKEVKTNGIDLGEMNAKLLKKIEELTLHLIEKEKETRVQNDRIKRLEESLFKLQSSIKSSIN